MSFSLYPYSNNKLNMFNKNMRYMINRRNDYKQLISILGILFN